MKPKKNGVYERLQGKNSGSYIKVTKVHTRKANKDSFCEIEAVYVDAWPNTPKRIKRTGTIRFTNFTPSSYRELTKAEVEALDAASVDNSTSEIDLTKFSSSRDRALIQSYLNTPEAQADSKAKSIFDKVIKYSAFASRKQRGYFYRLLKDAGADLSEYGKALNTPVVGEDDGQILEAFQAQSQMLQKVLDRLDAIEKRLNPNLTLTE